MRLPYSFYVVVMGAVALGFSQAMAQEDITAYSTTFDDAAALEGWTDHSVPGFPAKWAPPAVEDGKLVLRPASCSWYEDMQAGHLYREVTGDFIVTIRIKVESLHGGVPSQPFSLAGLFVRAPKPELTAENWQPGQEDWLFFSTGSASPAGERHFETKTTDDSVSTLNIYPAPSGWLDMSIARQGDTFTLLWRAGEGEWQIAGEMARPDMPGTVNVGLTAYADWPTAASYGGSRAYNLAEAPMTGDLIAWIDAITFARLDDG